MGVSPFFLLNILIRSSPACSSFLSSEFIRAVNGLSNISN
jgi:hypothetical protein